MRVYTDFTLALNEIKRDLAELSIEVQPQTMQDKFVGDDPSYLTKELQNYDYRVLEPRLQDLETSGMVHLAWCREEWEERRLGGLNPGIAWLERPEVWKEFLHDGRFAYTYSMRMGGHHLSSLIEELKTHPESRQLFLPVWDRREDREKLGGYGRVPCSLGYWFILRQGRLDMTYLQRSCDYATHLANDLYLATKLLFHVSEKAGVTPGNLVHWVGSMHIYSKDVHDVF